MSEYRVNLDIFAGPLDLLLYLVRKEEVDIYDIPISRVTQQYIQYLEVLRTLDIDLAGDFLVMAATLMEIKSAMLLPKSDLEDAGPEASNDPRAALVRQLLEYKKFKDAANMLQDAAEERSLKFTRSSSILDSMKPQGEPEIDLDQVSIWTLLEAFDCILKATGNRDHRYDHIKDDTPIDLYQIELLHRLQTEGAMTLQRVFEARTHRLILIGLFLAMLELIRNRLIWAEQPEPGGPIYLKPLTMEPAEQAVQKAIYANPEQTGHEEATVEQVDTADVGSAEAVEASDEMELPDDEFSRELSTIDVPDENAKPKGRIPILEIGPSAEAHAPAKQPRDLAEETG